MKTYSHEQHSPRPQVRTESAVMIGQSLAIGINDFFDQEATFKLALSSVLGIPIARIISVRCGDQ